MSLLSEVAPQPSFRLYVSTGKMIDQHAKKLQTCLGFGRAACDKFIELRGREKWAKSARRPFLNGEHKRLAESCDNAGHGGYLQPVKKAVRKSKKSWELRARSPLTSAWKSSAK